MRTRLPERQIAAQHRHTRRAKVLRQRLQERRLAIRACPVRQHKTVCISTRSPMQKPPHGRIHY